MDRAQPCMFLGAGEGRVRDQEVALSRSRVDPMDGYEGSFVMDKGLVVSFLTHDRVDVIEDGLDSADAVLDRA